MRFLIAERKCAERTHTHLTSVGMAMYTRMLKPTANTTPHTECPPAQLLHVQYCPPQPNPGSCRSCFFPIAPARLIRSRHNFVKIDATAGVCCQFTSPVSLHQEKVITPLTQPATSSHTPFQHESRKNPAVRSKDIIILQKEKCCMTTSKIQSKGQSTHRADTANMLCTDTPPLQIEQGMPLSKIKSKFNSKIIPKTLPRNFPQRLM